MEYLELSTLNDPGDYNSIHIYIGGESRVGI